MKKIAFIAVLCFVALSFNGFSQILVTSTGKVGINETAPAHNLHWYGTGCFGTTWGRLMFDSSGYGNVATMYPADDWVGCLGKTDKKFNRLYVEQVHAASYVTTSDERIKENIKTLNNPLAMVKKLRGVTYNIKSDYYKVEKQDFKQSLIENGKNQIGFLAQELKEVLPGSVCYDEAIDQYSVNYIHIIPVLVEAIKEQQQQIEELKKQIKK